MKSKFIQLALIGFVLAPLLDGALAAADESQDNLVLEEENEERQTMLDMERDVVQIIRSRGFEVEEHNVHTEDGYILTIHRVLNPLVEERDREQMKPVLMMHGIFTNSMSWVINSAHVRPAAPPAGIPLNEADEISNNNDYTEQGHPNSLAFYLANRGYDVWLGNSRGNSYANRHEQFTDWNPSFWNFTLDELIKFDLPATIGLIQRQTGHQKLAYVGYSQGSTVVFGLLAEEPEYTEILEPVVALAPVAFIDHMRSPIANLIKILDSPDQVNWWYKPGENAVGELAAKVCEVRVVKKLLCLNAFFLLVGFNEDELNPTRIDALLSHLPDATSVKVVAHWSQIAKSAKFQHFDRGAQVNQQLYGGPTPSRYHLGKIRSKLYLFVSDNDLIATPENVEELVQSLNVQPEVFNMSEIVPKWNHVDHLFSKRAGLVLNWRIEQVLRSNQNEPISSDE